MDRKRLNDQSLSDGIEGVIMTLISFSLPFFTFFIKSAIFVAIGCGVSHSRTESLIFCCCNIHFLLRITNDGTHQLIMLLQCCSNTPSLISGWLDRCKGCTSPPNFWINENKYVSSNHKRRTPDAFSCISVFLEAT